MKHHPDCDVNDVNPEGIKKPCNCISSPLEPFHESTGSAQPRRFYWLQCYELEDEFHWALCDTKTDEQGPPHRVTSLELILEAHEPKIFGRPLDGEYWPNLIVELLNAHFASNSDIGTNLP